MRDRTYRGHERAELLSIDDLMIVTQLGRQSVKKIAAEAGCLYKYGSVYKIDKNLFLTHFRKKYQVKGA